MFFMWILNSIRDEKRIIESKTFIKGNLPFDTLTFQCRQMTILSRTTDRVRQGVVKIKIVYLPRKFRVDIVYVGNIKRSYVGNRGGEKKKRSQLLKSRKVSCLKNKNLLVA